MPVSPKMTSTICTLFEGDYHHGVAALCNSLYYHGFRGVIYVGYRGPLPQWAVSAIPGKDCLELKIEPEFVLRFVPLTTEVHFANYKPTFMLSVWQNHCAGADAMFYFDPDITLSCRWSFFEEWVEGGVALCADVYADMPASHPFRRAWLRYFEPYGIQSAREQSVYYNSGFIGVAKENVDFLHVWHRLLQLVEPVIGGLQNPRFLDRSNAFNVPDQETLNVATMTCTEPLSCLGRQGMDFEGGAGYIMSHAVDVKPWRKKMLWSTLTKGQRPSRADKAYFKYVGSPIRLYGPVRMTLKQLDLLAGSALGRYIG